MLDATKALFLCGGDKLTVPDERRRGVAVESIEAENYHSTVPFFEARESPRRHAELRSHGLPAASGVHLHRPTLAVLDEPGQEYAAQQVALVHAPQFFNTSHMICTLH